MKLGIEKMGQRFSSSVETKGNKDSIITIRVRSIGLLLFKANAQALLTWCVHCYGCGRLSIPNAFQRRMIN